MPCCWGGARHPGRQGLDPFPGSSGRDNPEGGPRQRAGGHPLPPPPPSPPGCGTPPDPPRLSHEAAFALRAAFAGGTPRGSGQGRPGAVRGRSAGAGPGVGGDRPGAVRGGRRWPRRGGARGGARRGAVPGRHGHTWLSPPKRHSPPAGAGSSYLGPCRGAVGPVRSGRSVGAGAQGQRLAAERRLPPLRRQPRARTGPTCRHYEPDSREPPRPAERREQHPAVGAGHLRRPPESKSGGDAGTTRSAGGGRWRPPFLQTPRTGATRLFPSPLPFLPSRLFLLLLLSPCKVKARALPWAVRGAQRRKRWE